MHHKKLEPNFALNETFYHGRVPIQKSILENHIILICFFGQ